MREEDQPQPTTLETMAEDVLGGSSFLLGTYRLGSMKLGDKVGWDYLVQGLRAAEEYSPGRILGTFKLSHLLSPLETAAKQTRFISPDTIGKLSSSPKGRRWLEHISLQVGKNVEQDIDIVTKGFRFEGGKLYVGETGTDVLAESAAILRNPFSKGRGLGGGAGAIPELIGGSASLEDAFMRSMTKGPWQSKGAFAEEIEFLTKEGVQTEPFMVLADKTPFGVAKKYAFGYGTSLIERLNSLAKAPSEMPIVSDILKKIPLVNKLKLGVESSSGLKTLGALSWKIGVLGGLGYLGYQQLDYYARNSGFLDGTILSEGITAGVATLGVKSWRGLSAIAEGLGLHRYREAQEEIAPGSTDITKLLAFPIMGGLAGVGAGYAHRVFTQGTLQRTQKLAVGEAAQVYNLTQKLFTEKLGGEKVPEKILSGLSPKIAELAEQHAQAMADGRIGNVAKWIMARQGEKGIASRLLGVFGKGPPSLGKMLSVTGALIGAIPILPFIPGALVPGQRPDELARLYSGEQEVPIRKGRWWELSRTPFEGENETYFRPHWYSIMMARGKDRAIWGEDEPSPLSKWYQENFTYNLERKLYWERPYPESSPAFSDFPLIGPLLGATIGELVKPTVTMHEEEYRDEEGNYLRMPLKYGERLEDPSLGELPPPLPISSQSLEAVAGRQIYNFQQQVGLPGFAMSAVKENLTGSSGVFDKDMQMASAGNITSTSRDFYDRELGGMLGLNEFWRRLYPRGEKIDTYNPIPNMFATVDWLPGAGEKSENFKIGDPYRIPMGEIRLPGPGYAAQHPELEGVAPEDYPSIWKLKILSDIAPYSTKYGEALGEVREQKASGLLSERESEMFSSILEQIKAKKQRKDFDPYLYKGRASTESELALARINESIGKQPEEPSIFDRTVGSYWESLAHSAETPLDFLTPVSPGTKLVNMRTAVEDYERTQLYGSESAFWQHPFEDFLKPAALSAAHSMGYEGIPGEKQQQRDISEYFDILKYIKYTNLERSVSSAGNVPLAMEYYGERRSTLVGVDPFNTNSGDIYRALPKPERDYFKAFLGADRDERAQIEAMVPENEKAIYEAGWLRKDVSNWEQAARRGELSSEEEETAEQQESDFRALRSTEGFPSTDELLAEYKESAFQGESYADWYRRTKIIPQILEKKGLGLPGPSWVGFDPRVSLEDVKLKIVEEVGGNPYEYDLWPDRVKASARKPYLQGAAEELMGSSGQGQGEIRDKLTKMLSDDGITMKNIMIQPLYGTTVPQVELIIEDDRGYDIQRELKKRY